VHDPLALSLDIGSIAAIADDAESSTESSVSRPNGGRTDSARGLILGERGTLYVIGGGGALLVVWPGQYARPLPGVAASPV
jgi:hypothetical protein